MLSSYPAEPDRASNTPIIFLVLKAVITYYRVINLKKYMQMILT